jgi:D-methionine transport system ATP-binding protein
LFRFLSADQALAPSGALALERCGGVGGLNSLSSVRNPDCVGTVKGIADRVAVIDGGRIVEEGTVWSVFTNPRSETTRSLLSTIRPQLPDHIAQRLGQTPGGEAVISVDLAGPEANFPLFADLSAVLPNSFRLIHRGIDHIQEQPVARFFIGVPDPSRLDPVS